MADFVLDISSVEAVPARWLRRIGRQLLHNTLIFDFGAWGYAWMTGNPIWQANSAHLLDAMPARPDPFWVLDLGAGPGNSALAMGEKQPTARFIAFDLAQQMLALAAQQRMAAGWSVQRLAPVRGDAFYLPLADSSVDMVTGHSFLYLLPDYRAVLAEAYRVLRPGGYVAFLEPHAGLVDWSWLLKQPWAGLQISLSLWRIYSWLHRRFSAERLQTVLTEAGFHTVRTEVTLGGFGIFGRGQKS
ncbi:MAG: methyltransferase domain-containing protein [Chloroflexi bacterium]|nr:methyltransferase domain-containing protein [Chloroflexota bacterium]